MYRTKVADRDYTIEEHNHVSWASLTKPIDVDTNMSNLLTGEMRIFNSEFLVEALAGKIRKSIEGESEVNVE